jgi:hypothetical protein
MPIKKKLIVLWAFLAANLYGGAGLQVYHGYPTLWLGAIVAFGLVVRIGLLRCPRCGTRVYDRKVRFLGMDWSHPGFNPFPNYCAKCHLDFRNPWPSTPMQHQPGQQRT